MIDSSRALLAEKKILETSLPAHIKYLFKVQKGYPFTYSAFHNKVTAAFEEVLDGKVQNLLVLMPPRHSKTEIAKYFCTMGFARNPASEFIYACSDIGLALNCSSEIRNTVSMPEFKKYWDVTIRDDTSAKGLWKTDQGGSFWAGGFGSPIVGYGAGKMPGAMVGRQYQFGGAIVCFPYDEMVWTEKGLIKIGDIVEEKLKVKIFTYNFKSGKNELAPIFDFVKNEKTSNLVEIEFSDGSKIKCTEDHLIYTSKGWIEARHLNNSYLIPILSNSFNHVNRDRIFFAKIFPRFAIIANIKQLFFCKFSAKLKRIFNSSFLCKFRPSFANSNLTNSANIYSKSCGQFICRLFTFANLNRLLSGQLSAGPFFIKRKSAMSFSVSNILRFCAVSQILKGIIYWVAVKMPNLYSFFLLAQKRPSNSLMKINRFNFTANTSIESKIPPRIKLGLKNFLINLSENTFFGLNNSFFANYPSKRRNSVRPDKAGYVTPLFIKNLGHIEISYCLKSGGESNFYVGRNQAILVHNCDDPLKEQDRHRSLARQDMLSFYKEVLPTRKNSPKTPVIVIMQPLHKEDLGQWIKENRAEHFKILELPIIDDDQPLFPEVYSFEDLMALKEEIGNEMWQAKCLLRPIKLGGNLLKTNLLKHYGELPFLKSRWIEGDTAQKTEERHDYTVFQCWGKGYTGGIYLIDQFRGKVEYQDLKQRFKDFWNKHNCVDTYDPRKYGSLSCAYIEDKSSGTQIIQETRSEGNIPIIGVPRGAGQSKFERAVTIAVPKLESGYINIPADASFSHDLKEEMETFTGQEDSKQAILKMDKKKTFDDQVDCLISACEHGFTEFTTSSEVVKTFMERKLKRHNDRR
jgi:predicted phage terminase large subunit-like protein